MKRLVRQETLEVIREYLLASLIRAASMTVSTGFRRSQTGNPASSGNFYGLSRSLGGFLMTLNVEVTEMD